jgi:hypothetical protein
MPAEPVRTCDVADIRPTETPEDDSGVHARTKAGETTRDLHRPYHAIAQATVSSSDPSRPDGLPRSCLCSASTRSSRGALPLIVRSRRRGHVRADARIYAKVGACGCQLAARFGIRGVRPLQVSGSVDIWIGLARGPGTASTGWSATPTAASWDRDEDPDAPVDGRRLRRRTHAGGHARQLRRGPKGTPR